MSRNVLIHQDGAIKRNIRNELTTSAQLNVIDAEIENLIIGGSLTADLVITDIATGGVQSDLLLVEDAALAVPIGVIDDPIPPSCVLMGIRDSGGLITPIEGSVGRPQVDLALVNNATIAVGNGASNGQTQRVCLASDNDFLDVNLVRINGADGSQIFNKGNTGDSVLRVCVANDDTNLQPINDNILALAGALSSNDGDSLLTELEGFGAGVDVNIGSSSAQTQRVVVANDDPLLSAIQTATESNRLYDYNAIAQVARSPGDWIPFCRVYNRINCTSSTTALSEIYADDNEQPVIVNNSNTAVWLTSTNANDATGLGGARSVLVEGLDNSGFFHSDIVSMSGLVAVQSPQNLVCVTRLEVSETGGNDSNIGAIYCTTANAAPSTSNMWAGIEALYYRAISCYIASRSGYDLHLSALEGCVTAPVRLVLKATTASEQTRVVFRVNGNFKFDLRGYEAFPPNTRISVIADAYGGMNADVCMTIRGFEVPA